VFRANAQPVSPLSYSTACRSTTSQNTTSRQYRRYAGDAPWHERYEGVRRSNDIARLVNGDLRRLWVFEPPRASA